MRSVNRRATLKRSRAAHQNPSSAMTTWMGLRQNEKVRRASKGGSILSRGRGGGRQSSSRQHDGQRLQTVVLTGALMPRSRLSVASAGARGYLTGPIAAESGRVDKAGLAPSGSVQRCPLKTQKADRPLSPKSGRAAYAQLRTLSWRGRLLEWASDLAFRTQTTNWTG